MATDRVLLEQIVATLPEEAQTALRRELFEQPVRIRPANSPQLRHSGRCCIRVSAVRLCSACRPARWLRNLSLM